MPEKLVFSPYLRFSGVAFTVVARDICQYLQDNSILVRHFNQPRLRDYIWISIGTDEQKQAVLRPAV